MDKKTIIDGYLKMVFTLIPLYLLIGCFVLWSYLNEIGMLNLFTSIIDAKAALVALMVSFVFLSVSVVITFTFPSILLCVIYLLTGYNELRRVIKMERIPCVACGASILTLAVIMITSTIENVPEFIKRHLIMIMITMTFPIILYAVHAISITRKKTHIYFKNGKRLESRIFVKEKLIISFLILFSGIAITSPLSLILDLSSAYSYVGIVNLGIISIVVILMAFLPAMMFYSEVKYEPKIKNIIARSLIPALSFFVISMIILPNFASIVSRGALKNIGVVESTPHVFLIKKENYTLEMFPSSIWEHYETTNEKALFIKGTILLSLGQEILLCPKFVIDARTKYLKYNLDNLFSSRNEFHLKYLKQITRSCVLMDKSSVTQWDGILDGKNMLNV